METEQLLAALRAVSPALHRDVSVPVMQCFCFTGKSVHAFNDVVAVKAELQVPFAGGVQGAPLLAWLGSAGPQVDFGVEGDVVVFKSRKARLKTTLLPPAEFAFVPPVEPELKVIDPKVLSQLKFLQVSMNFLPLDMMWSSGATLDFGGDNCTAYSTNDIQISRVFLPIQRSDNIPHAIRLPAQFIKLLSGLPEEAFKSLLFYKDAIEARFEGIRVYSKIARSAEPQKYRDVFKNNLVKSAKAHGVALPESFATALQRCASALTAKDNDVLTLTVKDGLMRISGRGKVGKISDTLAIAGCADFNINIQSKSVLSCLKTATHFSVIRGAIMFYGMGPVHLVSLPVFSEKDEG